MNRQFGWLIAVGLLVQAGSLYAEEQNWGGSRSSLSQRCLLFE